MSAESEHIVDLFTQAKGKAPGEDRQRFLDEACRNHPEWRAELDSMLRAYDAENECPNPSTPECAKDRRRLSPLPRGEGQDEGQTGTSGVSANRPLETTRVVPELAIEKPGDRIDRYKLLEKIGEGGMGTVWMAEQTEPVRRRVALKLIKQGMDSGQVLARFEAERQALALMDHPNIAKVLEAGATASGRPYFVMELVKGIPFTKFCDDQRLSIRERLELFVPICQAIQHAHQKGIIHRDIKPSNVLVAMYDGAPVPKVIDFGVAKAIGQQLTERTLFTGFGAVIGTLEYMSPEQAEFNQLDIDTRSDIYSLGVLLYELLTGTTPLTRETIHKAAFDEVIRRIREEEPPRPSTRLSESKDLLPSISAQRKLDPSHLRKLVRGDLDWIVMKCLEKDRHRRYETANGLAFDVQRHLSNELVLARPPSNLYRFQKLIRRHQLFFAGTGTIIIVLLVGVAVSLWQAVRATRAERTAVAEREKVEKARIKAERAEQTARVVASMLGDALARRSDPNEIEKLFRDVRAMQKTVLGQEDVELDLQLAVVLQKKGNFAEAEPLLRTAISRLRDRSFDAAAQELPQLGFALNHLAEMRHQQKDLGGARSLAEEAASMYLRHPDWPSREKEHAFAIMRQVLEELRDVDGLSAFFRKVLEISRMRHAQNPKDFQLALFHFAKFLKQQGDGPEAAKVEKELREEYIRPTDRTDKSTRRPKLIGFWNCEANGLDSAATNNAFIPKGVVLTKGVVGQAFRLNGIEAGIRIPGAPTPQTMSIATWARFDSLDSRTSWSGTQYVIFRQNSRDNNFEGFCLQKMRDGAQDRFQFQLTSAQAHHIGVVSTNEIVTGVFYHVVGTFDGEWVCLYVNGLLHALAVHPYPIDYGPSPMWLGTTGLNWDGRLAGTIDEVRLYDGALSPHEVAALYRSESQDSSQ